MHSVRAIVHTLWLFVATQKVVIDMLPWLTRSFSEAIIAFSKLGFSLFAKLFDFALSMTGQSFVGVFGGASLCDQVALSSLVYEYNGCSVLIARDYWYLDGVV